MSGRSRHWIRVVVVVGVASVLAVAAGAWGAFGGVGTRVATFTIRLGSDPVTYATSYELDAAIVSVDKKAPYREYTLTISLALTDNAAPAQAFANGQTFASAQLDLLGADLAVVRTYELTDATVVAYRQGGNAATNTFDQELVLKSRSLAISTP